MEHKKTLCAKCRVFSVKCGCAYMNHKTLKAEMKGIEVG